MKYLTEYGVLAVLENEVLDTFQLKLIYLPGHKNFAEIED